MGKETPMDLARRLAYVPSADEKRAFEMGWDCGKNGPDTTNCHFGLFATRKLTDAWERGKKAAKDE